MAAIQLTFWKTGVYCWRNTVNGKVYVGSASVSISLRRRLHRNELRRGVHGNRHFQAAWRKYGEAAFTFEVIEECSPDDCLTREQFWIDELNATDPQRGYNICPVAGNRRGVKASDETRAKLSAAHLGKTYSEYQRASMRVPKPPRTAEHCAAMSAAQKGRVFTEEHKRKLSAGRKGKLRGEENVSSKLTNDQVVEIKSLLASGVKIILIAHRFQVHRKTISRIKSGERWAHV